MEERGANDDPDDEGGRNNSSNSLLIITVIIILILTPNNSITKPGLLRKRLRIADYLGEKGGFSHPGRRIPKYIPCHPPKQSCLCTKRMEFIFRKLLVAMGIHISHRIVMYPKSRSRRPTSLSPSLRFPCTSCYPISLPVWEMILRVNGDLLSSPSNEVPFYPGLPAGLSPFICVSQKPGRVSFRATRFFVI